MNPLLLKEGWLRLVRKCREATLAGADGVVRLLLILAAFQQGLPDRLQNSFRILKKNTVLESDYFHPILFEKSRPFCIVLHDDDLLMRSAIKFDNDATFWTIKVNDVGANTLLSPKFLT